MSMEFGWCISSPRAEERGCDDVVKDLSPALHFGDVPRSAVVGKVKDVT